MCQQHSTNCLSLAYLEITRVFKQNVSAALNQLSVLYVGRCTMLNKSGQANAFLLANLTTHM
jgi:hypothetical protein